MINKLQLKIGEIEFNLEGEAEFVEKERAIFLEKILPQAVDAMTRTRLAQTVMIEEDICTMSAIESSNSPVQKPTSINEFLKGKGFCTFNDLTLGIAYYCEKFEDKQNFSSDEIRDCFLLAKRKLPSNISECIRQLNIKGYIQPVANRDTEVKRYSLTTSGEEYIDEFRAKAISEGKTIVKPRKTRNKNPSIYLSCSKEDLQLGNYPELKSLKTFKEKMMLALYIITTEQKGEYFTTEDVICIMTHLFGEKANYNQINGVFRRESMWFNEQSDSMNKKIVRRKLLNGGLEFARTLISVKE